MLKCQLLGQRVEGMRQRINFAARDAAAEREALLAGAIAHAIAGDETVTAQNSFLAAFIRGTPLSSIVAQLGLAVPGAPANGASLRQTEVNGCDSYVESALERGTTLAADKKASSTAVLAFAGEQKGERFALYEKLRAAARSKLPIVCFVETSLAEMDALPPSPQVARTGDEHFPQIAVDGHDVVAVFRVAQEAIRRARTGHGPSMIECVMPEQTSQRSATHTARDLNRPLVFMQQYLERRNLWSSGWQQKIKQEFTQELDVAFMDLENSSEQQNRVDRPYSAKLDPEPASA